MYDILFCFLPFPVTMLIWILIQTSVSYLIPIKYAENTWSFTGTDIWILLWQLGLMTSVMTWWNNVNNIINQQKKVMNASNAVHPSGLYLRRWHTFSQFYFCNLTWISVSMISDMNCSAVESLMWPCLISIYWLGILLLGIEQHCEKCSSSEHFEKNVLGCFYLRIISEGIHLLIVAADENHCWSG